MNKLIIKSLTCFLLVSFASPCTTILVGKGLTADGSIIHAHNEDMGIRTVGRLWKVQQSASEIDSIWVPYKKIKNEGKNLNYWASGNTRQLNNLELNKTEFPYDNVLVGINESGLTMSCNWMYSKEDNAEGKGIRRYALRQLILERCSTAREAVELIGKFIDRFGQADWGGLTYVLADRHEGWIVETTTHHWVAKKLQDDEIIVVANRYTIGEEFDLASSNLVQFAVQMGWYKPENGSFNFKEIYGDPNFMNEMYDIEREERVDELLNEKKGNIYPHDLMLVLRDRYNNSDAYTPPTSYEPDRITCRTKGAKRPICSNLCQSSFVAHLRPNLPIAFGSMVWFTFATPEYGLYFPIYAKGTEIVSSFSMDNPEETSSSTWWAYRHIQQKFDSADDKLIEKFRKITMNKTKVLISEQFQLEKEMMVYVNEGKVKHAIEIMNKYTNLSAQKSLNHVKSMLNRIN